MRLSRFATLFSLCLIGGAVQACALMEPPPSRMNDVGSAPDFRDVIQNRDPDGRLLTPEEQDAAIRQLQERRR